MTTATTDHDHHDDQSTVIGAALARLHDALANRPGFGHSATTSVSTLGAGLCCVSSERSHEIATGMPPAFGGDGAAPGPTALLRAALGACLALGYRLHAAELGVELTSVQVSVDSESELVGMLDPDGCAPPGFTALRYRVEVESPSPAHDVERAIEVADRLSPVLDILTRPHAIERTVSIERTDRASAGEPGGDGARAKRAGARAPEGDRASASEPGGDGARAKRAGARAPEGEA